MNRVFYYELTQDPAHDDERRSIILCTGCGGNAFRSLQRDRITQVQRQRPQGPGLSRCQMGRSRFVIIVPIVPNRPVPQIVPHVHNGPVPQTPV